MLRVSLFALPPGVLFVAAFIVAAEAQTPLPEISVPAPYQLPHSVLLPGQNGGGDGKAADGVRGKENRALDQLNQQLRRKVDETNPSEITPPIDARSSDLKTGIVNIPGVQQQYGKNFGHSVIPYRPAAPVYTAPLGRR